MKKTLRVTGGSKTNLTAKLIVSFFLLVNFSVNSQCTLEVAWGKGSVNPQDDANGRFANAFNQVGSWQAISMNDNNGSPGNALWTRSTNGLPQGAYFSGSSAMSSPTVNDGAALFDSDFMDNNGVLNNFGNGSSASPHQGVLESPSFDLTSFMNEALKVELYLYYRRYDITALAVEYSNDGGSSWLTLNIQQPGVAVNAMFNTAKVTYDLPNFTSAADLTDCKIRLRFDGDYYFAMIDDISIYKEGSPTISSPVSDSRCGTGTLSLGATPSSGIVNWYDAASGGNLVGTGTTFTTPGISITTTYYAEALDGVCPSVSRTAIVASVDAVPVITAHPSNVGNICNYYNTSFSVTATGATGYQWEVSTNGGGNWNNVNDGGIYSGATTATLSLTDVLSSHNNYQYRCVMSGSCVPVATSNAATLTVNSLVNVPSSLSTTAVGLTTATVNWSTVSGSDMRIALRKAGTNTWHIKDATYADSYVYTANFTGDANYEWKVKVQDGGCWGEWSAVETFYVCKTPNAPTALMSTNVFTNKVTLSWTNPGADEIRIGLRKVGTTVWYYQNSAYADSYVYNGSFSKNASYEWRIKLRCGTEWGDWSSMANFTTGTAAGMIVNDTPGILAEDMFVEAFPNPNNGEFTIQTSHEGTFNIVNELGQLVQTIEIMKENNYQSNIDGLEYGIYFLTGTVNDEVITKKIMVTK